MPRNGSDIYYIPPGTEGFPDTTIESAKYNTYIHDVETDLNRPRPISSGGTGADDADEALANLHAEKAGQVVTNFDTHVWMAGSFYSTISTTAPPVAGHTFSGIAHITDANNMVVEAIDLTDPLHTPWTRVKTAGVWGAWMEGVTKTFVEVHAAITCADDPPTGNNASDNALWFESSTGLLYIRYNDGDTTQWTIACPQPDISTYALKTDVSDDVTGLDATKVAKAGDTMTGDLVINKATPQLTLDKTSGTSSVLVGKSGGLSRWGVALGDAQAESGANAGSDLSVFSYNDAGTVANVALTGKRGTGLLTVKGDPTAALGVVTKQYADAPSDGTIYGRQGSTWVGVQSYQRLVLAGLSSIDIVVPAGATGARMSGRMYVPTAPTSVVYLQLSVAAGVFRSTVGEYRVDGFYNYSTSVPPAIGNFDANMNYPGMLVGTANSSADWPVIFEGQIALKRPTTTALFAGDFQTAAINGYIGHSFLYNTLTAAAAGSTLSVLALRFITSPTVTWSAESYLNVEWL